MVDLGSGGMFGSLISRIRDSEDKLDLLKERLLLLNQTFISEQGRMNMELSAIKESMRMINDDTSKIKDGMERIIKESSDFARREELAMLERYIKMFDPIKKMIKDKDLENP